MRKIPNILRIGSIVGIAWFAAAALTPLTSVAIRNSAMTSTSITASTLDSTPIGTSSASSVRSSYFSSTATPPNPAAINTSMMGWNRLGSGETDFVNDYGTGSGGFNWFFTGSDVGHTWAAGVMGLSKVGNLAVAGTFSAGSTITAPSFSGPLTGNVTGNLSGTVTGSLNGNASSASAFNHTPSSCGTGQVATGINSAGNSVCVNTTQSAAGPGGVTGSGSFSTTSSVAVLSPGYGDTGYQAACTLVGPTDPRASIYGIQKSATQITVLVTTNGSAAISYAGVDCLVKHN
jgi:hypothetical protein